MILYFTGTGNSEYTAKRLAAGTGDEVYDLFEDIQDVNYIKLYSEKPWVIVYPTYAWRMPRILEHFLEDAVLEGSRQVYCVATCGDGIGNMGAYAKSFFEKKNMNFMGCAEVVMPENYLAMFSVPTQEEALEIIRKADYYIDQLTERIRSGKHFQIKKTGILDKMYSGPVNKIFYHYIVSAKKFKVSEQCVGCGKCVSMCPMRNIKLVDKKPVWGSECTHCMACITKCPTEAIEYGQKSIGKPRYKVPQKAWENLKYRE